MPWPRSEIDAKYVVGFNCGFRSMIQMHMRSDEMRCDAKKSGEHGYVLQQG
jgi:hypothetical protein